MGGYYVESHNNYPAVFLTRDDANAFCDWAELQLPTEAQWEWAARGPEGYIYPWGDDWNRKWCNNLELHAGPLPTPEHFNNYIWGLNIKAARERAEKPGLGSRALDVTLTTQCLRPAGSFPLDKSWCGAMDMAGSVQEWCLDFYDSYYYQNSAKKDPTGPNEGNDYAIRGGQWNKVAPFCRCVNRGTDIADNADHGRGFRPCLRVE